MPFPPRTPTWHYPKTSSKMNIVALSANLTADPEIRWVNTSDGQRAVCNIRLANNTRSGQRETVCFIDATCWGRTAENVAEYLKKGSKVLVQGELKQDIWEDRETGKKRSKHTITILKIDFISPREASDDAPAQQPAHAQPMGIAQLPEDNDFESQIPF